MISGNNIIFYTLESKAMNKLQDKANVKVTGSETKQPMFTSLATSTTRSWSLFSPSLSYKQKDSRVLMAM